ncbi:MAG TPA: glycosyltransferase family 4 protein, partial [Pelobium sp.]
KLRGGLESEMIYNGINFEDFKFRTNYENIAGKNIKLVQISRLLHQQKGQDILLEAIALLVNKFEIKNIHLDIVGDGPSEEYLKKLSESLKLQKYVSFLGPKDRSWVYSSLINYDVLVQPSRIEGFGITLIEAIATGLPVISSNIEGPLEVLENISSAYIFDVNKVEDLAAKIKQLIFDYELGQIEKKCLESFKVAEARFRVKDTAINYLNAYQKML